MARLALLVGATFLMAATKWACVSNTMDPIDNADDSDATFLCTLTLHSTSAGTTASFVFGEPIRFDLEVRNLTGRTVQVQFDDAQIYDFVVVDAGSSRVHWQWSANLAFAQMLSEQTFVPHSSKTFSYTWNGQLEDGSQLPAGSYRARGVMVFDEFFADPLAPGEMGSALQSFTVR